MRAGRSWVQVWTAATVAPACRHPGGVCARGFHPASPTTAVAAALQVIRLAQFGVGYDVGGRENNDDRYTAFSVALPDGRRFTVAGVRSSWAGRLQQPCRGGAGPLSRAVAATAIEGLRVASGGPTFSLFILATHAQAHPHWRAPAGVRRPPPAPCGAAGGGRAARHLHVCSGGVPGCDRGAGEAAAVAGREGSAGWLGGGCWVHGARSQLPAPCYDCKGSQRSPTVRALPLCPPGADGHGAAAGRHDLRAAPPAQAGHGRHYRAHPRAVCGCHLHRQRGGLQGVADLRVGAAAVVWLVAVWLANAWRGVGCRVVAAADVSRSEAAVKLGRGLLPQAAERARLVAGGAERARRARRAQHVPQPAGAGGAAAL